MNNKRKKINKDDKYFIDNGIFTEEELQSVDKMIDEIIEANAGREPTEEELLAFENCTEEDHFNAIEKVMLNKD